LAKGIQFDDSAIRLDILIWKFDLAYRFGNSIWHFDLAKRIQFDDSTIRFGNSIWQNEFKLTIWHFGLANRFAKWTKIVAPVFWHKDLAGEQLWLQQLWWCARNLLL